MNIEISHQILFGKNNYFITQDGRVKNIKFNRYLRTWINRYGYECISLGRRSTKKTYTIHRLIANAWIPNPHNKPTIDHINRNRLDNRIENLRWATHKEQAENRIKDGQYYR